MANLHCPQISFLKTQLKLNSKFTCADLWACINVIDSLKNTNLHKITVIYVIIIYICKFSKILNFI